MKKDEYIKKLREALDNASNALLSHIDREYCSVAEKATKECYEEAQEALALPIPQDDPAYVMMPTKFTMEMLDAAFLCTGIPLHRLIKAYQAMVAARPKEDS